MKTLENETTEKISIKDIFEEIKYVGLDHYLMDLTGYLIFGQNMHYHKKHRTSPKSIFLHSKVEY